MSRSCLSDNIINNSNQVMMQPEEDLKVQPENAITFYRNEYQSAATITLIRQPHCKQIIYYSLKTTHKDAYHVSSAKGSLTDKEHTKYIDIIINEDYPLEHALLDRFKLLISVQGRPSFQKKFKVIINYKKDNSKLKEKDLNRLQVASKTSGSLSTTTAPSILAHPIALAKKSMMKQSKLVHYLAKGGETDRVNLKEELDQVVKDVEERTLRLEYLNQEALKNKSRKKFGCYLTIIVIIFSLLLGLIFQKALKISMPYYEEFYV